MFGFAPYEENREMHEAFWSAHLNRVALCGHLFGARVDNEWRGFRCLFAPGGKGAQVFDPEFVREQLQ
jgi:hypothetical protein